MSVLKTNILKFIRPSQTLSIISIILKVLDLSLSLRHGLSHLKEHKLKYSFQGTTNPLCSCCLDIESTWQFPLHCPQFCTLLSTIGIINYTLFENTDSVLTQTLFLGNTSLYISDNTKVFNVTINFTLLTKRFDAPLF